MKRNLSLASIGIQRVLELTADAQIARRGVERGSPQFHILTGTIAAYGKTLALLAALQQREEFYAAVDQVQSSKRVAA